MVLVIVSAPISPSFFLEFRLGFGVWAARRGSLNPIQIFGLGVRGFRGLGVKGFSGLGYSLGFRAWASDRKASSQEGNS